MLVQKHRCTSCLYFCAFAETSPYFGLPYPDKVKIARDFNCVAVLQKPDVALVNLAFVRIKNVSFIEIQFILAF